MQRALEYERAGIHSACRRRSPVTSDTVAVGSSAPPPPRIARFLTVLAWLSGSGVLLVACTSNEQPSAPVDRSLSVGVAAASSSDYARFEADIVTSVFVDTTSLEVGGRIGDLDPDRRRTFRDAAQHPLVSAYHFASCSAQKYGP